MNLYRLTNKLGQWYMIAENPSEASDYLESQLTIADYGFFDERKVIQWELIASEVKDDFHNQKLNFSSGNKLLIKRV